MAPGYAPVGDAPGAGLLYSGTDLVEAVTEQPGKAAYVVRLVDGEVTEERLDTRLLST